MQRILEKPLIIQGSKRKNKVSLIKNGRKETLLNLKTIVVAAPESLNFGYQKALDPRI